MKAQNNVLYIAAAIGVLLVIALFGVRLARKGAETTEKLRFGESALLEGCKALGIDILHPTQNKVVVLADSKKIASLCGTLGLENCNRIGSNECREYGKYINVTECTIAKDELIPKCQKFQECYLKLADLHKCEECYLNGDLLNCK